jgi:nucleoredoxin
MKNMTYLLVFSLLLLTGAVGFAQDEPQTPAAVVEEPASEAQPAGEVKAPESSGVWSELFPDGLIDSSGSPVDISTLNGKIVGVYFSAHWCPPCRAFSPSLVAFRDKNADDFEVVFVSSDKNPEAQMEYMKEVNMSWPAVPHGADSGEKLKEKFEVVGIPMLVILGPNGQIISKSGRNEVSGSPDTCLDNWKAAAPK